MAEETIMSRRAVKRPAEVGLEHSINSPASKRHHLDKDHTLVMPSQSKNQGPAESYKRTTQLLQPQLHPIPSSGQCNRQSDRQPTYRKTILTASHTARGEHTAKASSTTRNGKKPTYKKGRLCPGPKSRYLVDGKPDTNTIASFLRRLSPELKHRHSESLKTLHRSSTSDSSFLLNNLPNEIQNLYRAEKHAAFVQTLSPRVRNTYEANHAVPFFKMLPPEIRLMIYDFVFDRKTIHVAVRDCMRQEIGSWPSSTWYSGDRTWRGLLADSLKLTHSICYTPHAEEEAYKKSKDPSLKQEETYEKRHERCLHAVRAIQRRASILGQWTNKKPWENSKKNEYAAQLPYIDRDCKTSEMNLSLLLVCREIHAEAALIPFRRTTFAFQSQAVLDRFILHCLLTPQREAVRHIQLHGGKGSKAPYGSRTVSASPFLINGGQHELKGLQSLEVSFNQLKSKTSSTCKFFIACDGSASKNPLDVRVMICASLRLDCQKRRSLAVQIEQILRSLVRKRKASKGKSKSDNDSV